MKLTLFVALFVFTSLHGISQKFKIETTEAYFLLKYHQPYDFTVAGIIGPVKSKDQIIYDTKNNVITCQSPEGKSVKYFILKKISEEDNEDKYIVRFECLEVSDSTSKSYKGKLELSLLKKQSKNDNDEVLMFESENFVISIYRGGKATYEHE